MSRRQVAEGILQLAVGLLLDQQPDRLGAGAVPWAQPWPGQTRSQAKWPDSFPLVPSRQVTLRRGRLSASAFRLTGRGCLRQPGPPRGRRPSRPAARPARRLPRGLLGEDDHLR